MKILITAKHLDATDREETPGGTGTYSYTLASELVKRGHSLQCYTPNLGLVTSKMKEALRIQCSKHLNRLDEPDVIHGQHSAAVEAYSYFKKPVVFVSHGIIDDEKPPDIPLAKLFVVSEELQEKYGGEILRNGIDLNRFRPITWLPKKDTALDMNALQGKWYTTNMINESPAVLAKGRSLLEAAACNRPIVMVSKYPFGGFGGIVTEENFHHLKKCNFSGRNGLVKWGMDNLKDAISKAIALQEVKLRRLVKREFDIVDMVDRLERTYKEAIWQKN